VYRKSGFWQVILRQNSLVREKISCSKVLALDRGLVLGAWLAATAPLARLRSVTSHGDMLPFTAISLLK
jgi:hypothetical protein